MLIKNSQSDHSSTVGHGRQRGHSQLNAGVLSNGDAPNPGHISLKIAASASMGMALCQPLFPVLHHVLLTCIMLTTIRFGALLLPLFSDEDRVTERLNNLRRPYSEWQSWTESRQPSSWIKALSHLLLLQVHSYFYPFQREHHYKTISGT